MLARPVASAIVDERVPWRVKCSVVTKLTAAGSGSVSAGSAWSVGSWFATVAPPASVDGLMALSADDPAEPRAGEDPPCAEADAGGLPRLTPTWRSRPPPPLRSAIEQPDPPRPARRPRVA